MKTSRCLLAAAALACSAAVSGQASLRIEISSSWSGLGSAPDMQMTIVGAGARFTSNGRTIDQKAVQELLNALDASSVGMPSLEECGGDQKWLEANYAPALKDVTHRQLSSLSKEQVDLFHSHFAGSDTSEGAFKSLVSSWHTDDYPKLSVNIHDGPREFGVTSASQGPFMLPWLGIGKSRGGYSCRISRAIYALLPKGFTNRDRLRLGDEFRWNLAQKILDEVQPEWDVLNANHFVGSFIAPITERYTVQKSAISNLSSIDLDGAEAWNAELRAKSLPPNLILGVSLSYKKKQLDGVDTFLRQSPTYADLVLGVPWLRAYMHDNPQAKVEMRFVDGRSLSPKATRSLATDLRTHGKPELAGRVERDAAESAFIEVNSHDGCWARAVVFPDKQVLLWHFKCDDVFAFHGSKFATWDFYGWRSTGTIIQPDGTPQD